MIITTAMWKIHFLMSILFFYRRDFTLISLQTDGIIGFDLREVIRALYDLAGWYAPKFK